MSQLLIYCMLAFGLPWNLILWFFYIRPNRYAVFSDMEWGLGILIYSIYGIIFNGILFLTGVLLCLLA